MSSYNCTYFCLLGWLFLYCTCDEGSLILNKFTRWQRTIIIAAKDFQAFVIIIHAADDDDVNSPKSQFCNATYLCASRQQKRKEKQEQKQEQKREHITIPELVKKLTVLPGKRTDEDCKLMAGALYAFVSSMEAWKDGLLISSNHTNTALSRIYL